MSSILCPTCLSKTSDAFLSARWNLISPKEKNNKKILAIIPHLFFEIKVKNKKTAKPITLNKIILKISTKIKERKSTPKVKPKVED